MGPFAGGNLDKAAALRLSLNPFRVWMEDPRRRTVAAVFFITGITSEPDDVLAATIVNRRLPLGKERAGNNFNVGELSENSGPQGV